MVGIKKKKKNGIKKVIIYVQKLTAHVIACYDILLFVNYFNKNNQINRIYSDINFKI